MERNFYTDDFERLLKERSDEFRMYPSKRVWHSIYNDLHPGRKWPSVAVSLLLIAALFITGYWNSSNHTTKTIAASSNNLSAGIPGSGNSNEPLAQQTIIANADSKTDHLNINPASSNSNTVNTNSASVTVYTSNTKRATEKRIYSRSADNSTNKLTQAEQNSGIGYVKNIKLLPANADISERFKSGSPVLSAKESVQNNTDVLNRSNNNSSVVNPRLSADLISSDAALTTSENSMDAVTSKVSVDKVNDAAVFETTGQSAIDKKTGAVVTIVTGNKSQAAGQQTLSTQDKAWVDDYAFYNRTVRKKWKDRVAQEFYITPGVGFRNFSNNSSFDAVAASNSVTVPFNSNNFNTTLHQKPGIGLEGGIALVYSLSKKIRVKAGIQANYTSYTIYGEETNHPVLTTLRLTNINTGFPYLDPRTATLANSGLNTAKIHNSTYQVSIPLGLAFKLAGSDKLEWYAGASIQPTFIVNGKANLISDDRKNYVADPTLLRRWNLNSGFETYIHYKLNGFTLQAGPQFRYQLLSTYSSQYTINENLYNLGLKIGILKNF